MSHRSPVRKASIRRLARRDAAIRRQGVRRAPFRAGGVNLRGPSGVDPERRRNQAVTSRPSAEVARSVAVDGLLVGAEIPVGRQLEIVRRGAECPGELALADHIDAAAVDGAEQRSGLAILAGTDSLQLTAGGRGDLPELPAIWTRQ